MHGLFCMYLPGMPPSSEEIKLFPLDIVSEVFILFVYILKVYIFTLRFGEHLRYDREETWA